MYPLFYTESTNKTINQVIFTDFTKNNQTINNMIESEVQFFLFLESHPGYRVRYELRICGVIP